MTSLPKLVLAGALALIGAAQAQVPVTPAADHAPLLASPDSRLAANKRLVYDFWREVLEAGQLERAEHYLRDDYIQHNPSVPTGRAGFVEFFRTFTQARPVQARVRAPLVSIVAEGDWVVLSFVRALPEPKEPGRAYTTTGFDMFRVQDGRIAEHWDPTTKRE